MGVLVAKPQTKPLQKQRSACKPVEFDRFEFVILNVLATELAAFLRITPKIYGAALNASCTEA